MAREALAGGEAVPRPPATRAGPVATQGVTPPHAAAVVQRQAALSGRDREDVAVRLADPTCPPVPRRLGRGGGSPGSSRAAPGNSGWPGRGAEGATGVSERLT